MLVATIHISAYRANIHYYTRNHSVVTDQQIW